MTAFDFVTRVSNETYSPYYEVTSAYHGARVGRSWTPDDQDDTHIASLSTFRRVTGGSCAVFKRQGLRKRWFIQTSLPDEVS